MRQRLSLFFFLVFLVSYFGAYSLGVNERVEVKILDILKDNQVSINRGIADGLVKNTHVKINSSEGYHARGLVIFTKENFSILQLYRILNRAEFSRDEHYQLYSMELSGIAPQMKSYLYRDFSNQFKNFQPRKSNQPHKVKSDLPKEANQKALQEALGQ